MIVRDKGPHAVWLETRGGVLLFSYGVLVAARWGGACLRSPDVVLSPATRAHLRAFHPAGKLPQAVNAFEFRAMVRRILESEGG